MGGDERDETDFYAVLHVDPQADDAAIRAAYRRLSRNLHPDKSGVSSDDEKMQELNRAYYVLTRRRKEYDSNRKATNLGPPSPPLHDARGQPETRARAQPSPWERRRWAFERKIRPAEEKLGSCVFGCGILFLAVVVVLVVAAILFSLLLNYVLPDVKVLWRERGP